MIEARIVNELKHIDLNGAVVNRLAVEGDRITATIQVEKFKIEFVSDPGHIVHLNAFSENEHVIAPEVVEVCRQWAQFVVSHMRPILEQVKLEAASATPEPALNEEDIPPGK